MTRDILSLMTPFLPVERMSSDVVNRTVEFKKDEEKDTLSLLVPGFDKDEIKINVSGNKLSISGEKSEESNNSISKSKFSYSFSLDSNSYDTENIKASLENGILQIELNKTENSNSHMIEIK